MNVTSLRIVRRCPRTCLAAALLALLAPTIAGGFAAAQTPAPGYKIVKRIPVGGDGGWDYLAVDPGARRLYVSHATHVVVVDLARDTIVGDIANTPGVHGIAFDHALGRGFTSNGRDSTVTIFDLKTLREIARVNVGGANPDAIGFDPFTKRVFTMNGRSSNASAIDPATGQVVGHIDLGGRPEEVASDGKGRLYINLEDKSEIAEVDPKALTVLRRWSIAPCEGPSGIAIDVAHRRLFSVCDKVMAISDLAAGKLLTTVTIGDGPDGAGFDPGRNLAFSSNGDGTLTVVRANGAAGYAVQENATTQRGARTMTLDPKTHRIYTATAEFGPAPAPTPERPRPRPSMVPNTFVVLVIERVK
jgi:DNA-binding beta-propeller fold protein YncE